MNLTEKVLTRIYWQFRNSPKLIEWMSILPGIAQEQIEDPAQIIADILDIDNIYGDQLDIVGRIVGLARPTVVLENPEGDLATYRRYLLDLGDGTLLDLGDGDALEIQENIWEDELFRVLIKAKIERNNGDATINNIVRTARFIFGIEEITVADNQDMTWTVFLGGELDNIERYVISNLDILPRPQGTRFAGFIEANNDEWYGFSDQGEIVYDSIEGLGELDTGTGSIDGGGRISELHEVS